jgi:hypothetical protein
MGNITVRFADEIKNKTKVILFMYTSFQLKGS